MKLYYHDGYAVAGDGSAAKRLILHGPIIKVELTPWHLPAPRVTARLLLDTGSDISALAQDIIGSLGLSSLRPVQARLADGRVYQRFLYRMSMHLPVSCAGQGAPGGTFMFSANSVGQEVHSPPDMRVSDGLIGRDFLSHFQFRYDGETGSFRLEVRQ